MKIDDLIRTYCPEGVKRVRLEEVCKKICSGGTPLRNISAYFEGNIPWMRTQEVDWKDVYDTEIKITEEAVKNSAAKLIPINCVIIAMYGATAAKACINKIPLTTNQACCNLQIDPKKALYKYVYYWICCRYKDIKAMGEGSQNNINAQKIKNLLIPLPPLPIQQTIVSYLDKLTSLTAELEAELELQKKRYDFYRNRLLSFAPDSATQFDARLNSTTPVKWMKLGEIGTFTKGSGILKSDFVEEGFPCIHYGQVHTSFQTFANKEITYISEDLAKKCKKAHKGDLIIASTSEDVEACCKAVAWMGDYDVAVSGDAHIFSHNQNPKYMAYLFQTEMFQKQKRPFAVGAKVIRVKSENMEKFCFPLPPLSEQERIVGILDKYETLVHNTQEGIPALIAAVKQKYEYYRERMLTF